LTAAFTFKKEITSSFYKMGVFFIIGEGNRCHGENLSIKVGKSGAKWFETGTWWLRIHR
jgi:hypothetical protein